MEFGMGFRASGNSSWSKKHEIEIHYELNGLISKGMVHPREMVRYACPETRERKREGNVNGFGSGMGSLGRLLIWGRREGNVNEFGSGMWSFVRILIWGLARELKEIWK
jgi:hypothetical protein